MRKELDEKLCRDFPLLYKDRAGPMQETCMCWGFDIGDGWFDLVYKLSESIERELEDFVEEYHSNVTLWDRFMIVVHIILFFITKNKKYEPIELYFPRAAQVKEKFGGLRFYMTGGTDEIFGLIERAEEESYAICEQCGEPGRETGNGWIRTLCEDCEKNQAAQGMKQAEKWEDHASKDS